MTEGTITRRLDSALDGLDDEFKALYWKKDFENALLGLKYSYGRSDWSSKVKKICNMFDNCGIECRRDGDLDYYRNLVKISRFPSEDEIESKIISELEKKIGDYPLQNDYLMRSVDRLSDKNDGWENDTLRLRILKQFIKYGNYLSEAGFGGRLYIETLVKQKTGKKADVETVLRLIDDHVFDVLDTATGDRKKPNGKFGLIKLVDDLALGKFRAGGATKKSLYLFAMVYGMTFSTDDGFTDVKTDIEINLFRDYYANNLMRFLMDTYNDDLCEYEPTPSEQGINYKNFAEMVYLYYISQNDMPPCEKIRRSYEMTERIKNSDVGAGNENVGKEESTFFYKERIRNAALNDSVFEKSEEEFERFIVKNYNCRTKYDSFSVGAMELETEQRTAYGIYREIIDLLEEQMPVEECDYGLSFIDEGNYRGKMSEQLSRIIKATNSFLKQDLRKISERNVSRTSIIVAYYYYFNTFENDTGSSFEEVFNEFKSSVDEFLSEAGYQPFSGRNLIDVLIALSSYARINL